MSDLARSVDSIRFRDNFYAVTRDIHLAHFKNFEVQATPEDNLKLYVVLGSRAGSLRA